MTSMEDLLRECTVRIDIDGQASGTGFFVAPGTVVTCAHVLEQVTLAFDVNAPSRKLRDRITLVDHKGTSHPATLDPADVWDDEIVDLALVRLDSSPDHPIVLLDSDCRAHDIVDSFGYEKKYRGGLPTSLTVEGEMGEPNRWFKLASGQVQPGMSGSGLVNQRTGGVCGVLKRTRAQHSDLGGYAIPITVLNQLAVKVIRENQRLHAQGSRWVELLPPELRRRRNKAQSSRFAEDAPDRRLVISVGQTDDGWEVSADIHPEGLLVEPIPIDLNKVRLEVARLFRDWSSRGDWSSPGRFQQGVSEVGLLGSILSRAVLPGDIGERFSELRKESGRLAITLRFEDDTDPDLIQLPWEHLYYEEAAGAGTCLARDGRTTFARALGRTVHAAKPPSRHSLRVLLVAVRPEWATAGEAAISAVDEVVRDLESLSARNDSVDVVRIEENSPDASAIEQVVADFHVVHYVGFGRFTGASDQLALGGDGEFGIEYVGPQQLADALAPGQPELLVLQLLRGREIDVPADLSVFGSDVLKAAERLQAVLGWQYPTTARSVTQFNRTLYEQLGHGSTIEVAVQEARIKMARGRMSVSPALFVRSPSDARLTAPGRDVAFSRRSGGADAAHG